MTANYKPIRPLEIKTYKPYINFNGKQMFVQKIQTQERTLGRVKFEIKAPTDKCILHPVAYIQWDLEVVKTDGGNPVGRHTDDLFNIGDGLTMTNAMIRQSWYKQGGGRRSINPQEFAKKWCKLNGGSKGIKRVASLTGGEFDNVENSGYELMEPFFNVDDNGYDYVDGGDAFANIAGGGISNADNAGALRIRVAQGERGNYLRGMRIRTAQGTEHNITVSGTDTNPSVVAIVPALTVATVAGEFVGRKKGTVNTVNNIGDAEISIGESEQAQFFKGMNILTEQGTNHMVITDPTNAHPSVVAIYPALTEATVVGDSLYVFVGNQAFLNKARAVDTVNRKRERNYLNYSDFTLEYNGVGNSSTKLTLYEPVFVPPFNIFYHTADCDLPDWSPVKSFTNGIPFAGESFLECEFDGNLSKSVLKIRDSDNDNRRLEIKSIMSSTQLHLHWFELPTQFKMPQVVNLQSYFVETYKRELNNLNLAHDASTSMNSDYIRLNDFPDLMVISVEPKRDDLNNGRLNFDVNKDLMARIDSLTMVVNNNGNAFQQTLNSKELYLRTLDNLPKTHSEYPSYYENQTQFLVVIRPYQLSQLYGAGINQPVELSFNIKFTNKLGRTVNNWVVLFQGVYCKEYIEISKNFAVFKKQQISTQVAQRVLESPVRKEDLEGAGIYKRRT